MRYRAVAAIASVVLAACANGGEPVPSAPVEWEGARALTGVEDHAFGAATNGAVAVFATGGSQVGENAVRIVPVDGSAPSSILVQEPGGLIPSGVFAIDGDDLYLAASNEILRVPLAGGEAVPVVRERPTTVTSFAVDDEFVWWTTAAYLQPERAEVARAPKDGSGPVEVLASPDTGRGSYTSLVLGADGDAFVASPAGIVHVAPERDATVLVTSDVVTGAVTRLARNGDHLFGIVAGGRNDLFTVPVGGGDPVQVARKANNVMDLRAAGDGVLFFDGSDDLRYATAAGGEPVLVATGERADGAIAVSGSTIVFPAGWRIFTIELP